MKIYLHSPNASYEVLVYNRQEGLAKLRGSVAEFYLELDADLMERHGWTLSTEDGSHAKLEELQEELQA